MGSGIGGRGVIGGRTVYDMIYSTFQAIAFNHLVFPSPTFNMFSL